MCSGSNALCNRKGAYWEHFCLLVFFPSPIHANFRCLKVTKSYHQKASTSTDLFLLIFMALLEILTLVAMGWLMVKNMII